MDQREKMNVITILKIGPINIYVNFFSNIEPTSNCIFNVTHHFLFLFILGLSPQHSNQMGPDPFCWVDGFSNIYLDYLLFRILHIPLY